MREFIWMKNKKMRFRQRKTSIGICVFPVFGIVEAFLFLVWRNAQADEHLHHKRD
jgi:hypothetical protein